MLYFPLPCGQPNANRWTKRLIETRRCLPPLKCPVAWRLLLIAEVKTCFITIFFLQLPCQPPFLGPWRESVSSSLSNANSAFGLILGFFSYHGWNIYLLPAGCFKQAALCWDIQRACVEQAWQKLFRHFYFSSTLKMLLSAQCVHTCLHLYPYLCSGWKGNLDISVWKHKLKLKSRCFSLKYLEVPVWNLVTTQPTHDKALVSIWRSISFMDCFHFMCTLYLIFFHICRGLTDQFWKWAGRFSSQMTWEEWERLTVIYYPISVWIVQYSTVRGSFQPSPLLCFHWVFTRLLHQLSTV